MTMKMNAPAVLKKKRSKDQVVVTSHSFEEFLMAISYAIMVGNDLKLSDYMSKQKHMNESDRVI